MRLFPSGDLSQCSLDWYPATAKANKKLDFANLRIYGLLADLDAFHFYSYDPSAKEFAFDKTLIVDRDSVLVDMIPGTCLSLLHT